MSSALISAKPYKPVKAVTKPAVCLAADANVVPKARLELSIPSIDLFALLSPGLIASTNDIFTFVSATDILFVPFLQRSFDLYLLDHL